MKVLSVRQPYATLLVIGAKAIETKARPSNYRGELGIHASARFDRAAMELCRQEPFRSALARAGYLAPDALPTGAILGIVEMMECCATGKLFEVISRVERSFGDYRPGRYGWVMSNPRAFTKPIPAKGALSFWNHDIDQDQIWPPPSLR